LSIEKCRFSTFFVDFFSKPANNRNMEIDKALAQRLVDIRKVKKITQAKFAEALGIKRSTLAGLENGQAPIIDRNIRAVCLAYNVNENWLKTGKGEMFTVPPNSPEGDDEKRLLDMFRRLPAEMREYVLRKVRELLALAEPWDPAAEAEAEKGAGPSAAPGKGA
jgi:transcriptional regulator with XRE-family HTH domain